MRALTLAALIALGSGIARAATVPLVAVGDASPLGLPFSRLSDPALGEGDAVTFVGAAAAVFRRDASGAPVHVLGAGDPLAGRQVAGAGAPDLATGGCLATRVLFIGGGAAIVRHCGVAPELVAETGDALPGGGSIAAFGAEVRIGVTGRVAFTALLAGGTTVAVFADAPHVLTELARTGGPSPAGGTFASLRVVGVSGSGQVGFRATVSGGRDGLFYWNGAATAKLVVEGDATPAGGSFDAVGLATMSDGERWAFRATRSLDGASGLFTADTAPALPVPAFAVLVLQGDPSPLGGTFRQFPTSGVPSINAAGAVAFRATLDGAVFPAGVFVAAAAGDVRSVVGVGEQTPAGQLFRLRQVALADDGAVLLRATLSGGTPGLFRGRAGRVDGFALLGDATDLGTGFRFGDPSARASPETAVFLGEREGLFVARGRGVETVAALGFPTPVGGTYAGIDPPTAGAGGRVVFGASVQGGTAGEALFALAGDRVRTLVRTGVRVRKGTRLLDLFADPLDGLERAGAGRGGVAFQAGLGGGSADSGLFVLDAGRLRTRALEGRPAPRGGRYRAFGTPAVLGRRRVAFVAEVGTRREANLILLDGARRRAVAAAGGATGTRLGGTFRALGPPAAAGRGATFRATLDDGSREGLFVVERRGPIIALLGSGDEAPGGGRFRAFGDPTGVGDDVVARADVVDGASAGGLFRLPAARATAPADARVIATVGAPTPFGGSYLAFGAPAGSASGTVAFRAELSAGPAVATLVVVEP